MRRLLLVLLLSCSLVAWAATEFRVFTLQHRFAEELLPAVQPLVGADGSVSAVDNLLLVDASPERLAAIEQLLQKLDTELKQLRITVRHEAQENSTATGVAVGGSVHGDGWRVRLPGSDARRGGVTVDIAQNERQIDIRANEYVHVMDGARAVIAVGQSVPYTESWLVLTRRHAHLQQTVRFQTVATGFLVRPRSLGEEVELEITPRIAEAGAGGVIEFATLSTTVRVRPGAWFDLGGHMRERDEVSRAILGATSGGQQKISGLWVLVE